MSIIIVQVGQCGNQVGEAVWRALAECSRGKASPFFAPRDMKARCVLVDSEPKVVQSIVSRNSTIFRPDSAVTGSSGRGNNWGAGYHGLRVAHRSPEREQQFRAVEKDQHDHDDSLLVRALRAIHHETTHVEDGGLEAIVVIHSLAGGTGSGFGCKLVEMIRQHFIRKPGEEDDAGTSLPELEGEYGQTAKAQYVLSVAIAPSKVGETAVQGINTALTLGSLLRHTDCMILLRNDFLAFKTFADTNSHFATLLLPLFGFGTEYGAIGDLIVGCAPSAELDSYYGKVLTLAPMGMRRYAPFYESCDAVSVYHPSSKSNELLDTTKFFPKHAQDVHLCTRERRPATLVSGIKVEGQPVPGTIVFSQRHELTRYLFEPLKDAAFKLHAKAYLHQYAATGISADFIRDSLRTVVNYLEKGEPPAPPQHGRKRYAR